jgi:hypothetical protein
MTDKWINATGGDWETGSNWSQGSPPSGGTIALTEVGGSTTPYSVSLSTSPNIVGAALRTSRNATLNVTGGANPDYIGSIINHGTLEATGGAVLVLNLSSLMPNHNVTGYNYGAINVSDTNSKLVIERDTGTRIKNYGTMTASGSADAVFLIR